MEMDEEEGVEGSGWGLEVVFVVGRRGERERGEGGVWWSIAEAVVFCDDGFGCGEDAEEKLLFLIGLNRARMFVFNGFLQRRSNHLHPVLRIAISSVFRCLDFEQYLTERKS